MTMKTVNDDDDDGKWKIIMMMTIFLMFSPQTFWEFHDMHVVSCCPIILYECTFTSEKVLYFSWTDLVQEGSPCFFFPWQNMVCRIDQVWLTACTASYMTFYIFFSSLRNEKALKNFNDANFYLRGNRLINYQQLGLKSKLYLCEVRNPMFPEPVAFFIFNAVYFILFFHCLFASVCLLFIFYHLN